MAQTKRKRKHRGNAAGMVETRGRTSRPASPTERKKQARATAAQARLEREPSWTSAANRAAIASVIFGVALILLFGQPVAGAIGLAAFMFVVYIPLGYYTDQFIYRRRMKRKAEGKG